MPLVDLQTAKEHLRVDHAADDVDILLKLEMASSIVVNYLKLPVGTWELDPESSSGAGDSNVDDAPWPVQAAVLLVLGSLYKDREGQVDPLSEAAKSLLHRYRDPALA